MTDNYKLVGIKASGSQRAVSLGMTAGQQKTIQRMSTSQTVRHALMADKLTFARNIKLTNEVLGQALFDGSDDIEIYTAVERITNAEMEEMLT